MPARKLQKAKVVEIVKPQVEEARQNFASHVQSIAFNLTLSRRQINCLQAVRDYGWPTIPWRETPTKEELILKEKYQTAVDRIHHRESKTFITHNFVGFMQALKNRGLILWNHTKWDERKRGERAISLSRAGKLVCELLVEAGLMDPVEPKEARR